MSVAWLVLRKNGRITIAFVLVHLLSQCNVGCAGRLLQHGGIRIFLAKYGYLGADFTNKVQIGWKTSKRVS